MPAQVVVGACSIWSFPVDEDLWKNYEPVRHLVAHPTDRAVMDPHDNMLDEGWDTCYEPK